MQPPTNGTQPPETPDPAPLPVQPPPRRLTKRELAARFPVTLTLTLVTVFFFAMEWFLGGTTDVQAQLRLGALRGDLVFTDGEYFRLICTAFLHHSIIHFGLNWLAFLQLGALVEYMFGSWRLVAVYLFCAITSSLAAGLMMPPIPAGSRGASGAIMGIAGLLLGASWFAAEPTRSELRKLFGKRLVIALALTFALGLIPMIDGWGHFGGFVGGMLAALFYRAPSASPGAGTKLLAVLLTLATLGSFGWMAAAGEPAAKAYPLDQARYQRAHIGDPVGPLERLLDVNRAARLMLMLTAYEEAGEHEEGYAALEEEFIRDGADSDELNLMAWILVTRRDVSNRDPERARTLATASLDAIPDPETEAGRGRRAATLDTLAESLFQLGRLDEALTVQRESAGLAEALSPGTAADIQLRLARILFALGKLDETRSVLLNALSSAPVDAPQRPDLEQLLEIVEQTPPGSVAPVNSL